MKNTAWLYRQWANILDMCEGTEVDPNDCWVLNGLVQCSHPKFTGNPDDYEFAVAILDNGPVFVGETIYNRFTGESIIVERGYVYYSY